MALPDRLHINNGIRALILERQMEVVEQTVAEDVVGVTATFNVVTITTVLNNYMIAGSLPSAIKPSMNGLQGTPR